MKSVIWVISNNKLSDRLDFVSDSRVYGSGTVDRMDLHCVQKKTHSHFLSYLMNNEWIKTKIALQ